jgi:hypothetical protein
MAPAWPEEETTFFDRLVGLKIETDPPSESVGIQPRPAEEEIEILRNGTEPPNLQRAKAGLIAAMQLETLDAFQAVVEYVNRLEIAVRDELLHGSLMRLAFDRMEEEAGGKAVPKNWVEWMARLEEVSISEAQEFAKRAAEEWQVHDQLRVEADVRELADAISKVPSSAHDRLFDTITHLVQWVQHDAAWPEKHLVPLYQSIYEHLMLQLSNGWWKEAAGTARELLDGLLQLGPDTADYAWLLNDMGDVLPPEAGATDFEFLMELTELTVIHSSPDPNVRQQLWSRIVGALGPIRTRLSRGDLALVNDLGQVFDMAEVFPVPPVETEDESTEPNQLDGKLVAIYTLTEQAGERARKLLMDLYPNVRVELSHDKEGNTRLEGLARNADIFVVCWRSAAHAATDIISRFRPDSAITLYPTGKGWTSILRAIENVGG